MRAWRAVFLLLLSSALPLGCDHSVTVASESLGGPLSPQQIVGALVATDRFTIDRATVALAQGAVAPAVQTLANTYAQAATAAMAQLTTANIAPHGSPETDVLIRQATTDLNAIGAVPFNTLAVDFTYLCAQLSAEVQALTLIDNRLLPEAANDATLTAIVQANRDVLVQRQQATEAVADALGLTFANTTSGFQCQPPTP
jgi:hypothetical protein